MYSKLRKILPTTGYLRFNGIYVDIEKKGLDWLFPKYRNLNDIPNYEAALVLALKERVHPKNTVVIVGGGYGVTACVAARRVGPNGRVICYEGNVENAAKALRAVSLNGVEKQVEIHSAIVAGDIGVYEGKKASTVIAPLSLPFCDVLQLDCEGSEIEIISSMIIDPPIIIVETHGYLGAPTNKVAQMLSAKGYDVRNYGPAEPRMGAICEELDVQCLIGLKAS